MTTTWRRNETAATERARDGQRRDKKTAAAMLHGSRPVQENAEGTNWAKQTTYVETSRKVGQRCNQGARDGKRSHSHMATNVRTNDKQASPRTNEKQRESTWSSSRGKAVTKATKRTILTSERRVGERSDVNYEEGRWRRNTARAQEGGRTARLGEDTRNERRRARRTGWNDMTTASNSSWWRKGETPASGGAKKKIRKPRHRGPGDGMALRMTLPPPPPPPPCSPLETAVGPRRGPPSETSLGGNRHQR